jgi:predicted porin
MKKSLVALAVLAASGAAMAQVSITGNLTAGFRSTDNGNGATASGFGVDTAEVVFTATEDLGGGMKASAKLGLVDASRGNTAGRPNTGFGPGDSELSLSGGFGKLALSTARGADYLSGGVAGVGGTFMDGRVLSNRVSRDSVAYSMPLGPVTVGVTYSEAPNLLGLDGGTSGGTTGAFPQSLADVTFPAREVALSVQYSDGPLVADFGYLTNDDIGAKNQNHIRGAISYDLGVAKLGGGMERQSWEFTGGDKVTVTDTLLAVSVPLGATTLSANWAQREVSDQAAENGKFDGYGLKASYALSKRTSFSVDYTNWANDIDAKKQSEYNIFLSHSF